MGACKERGAYDGPHADIVADAIPRIEQQLNLKFKTPPTLETRSRAEVAKFVAQQLTSDRAKRQIEGQQSAYRLMGLVPDTMDVGALLQRLLEEQIIGYYDPKTKVLYVVEGSSQDLLQQTVTHELVHALQDQYVPIDSIQADVSNADRQSSAQAVLEGQAVYTQLFVDPNAGPVIRMPGGWDRIRDVIRDGQTVMPVFASAPRAIREGLLFPYLGGADFVRRFVEHRPIEELLTDLPVSSRQILNDASYFTASPAERAVPINVTLPTPSRGTVVFSNSFGEFETRLILVEHLKDEVLARRAAGGLAGDQFTVVRTPSGDAMVWASVWDSSVDAADFMTVMADAARRRYDVGKQTVAPGATTRRLDVSAGKTHGARTVLLTVEQRAGHPVVTYMDIPAGTSPTLIDLSRLTIGQ